MIDITTYDMLCELAIFDFNDFINQQLQDDYGMEAYEENLEKCIDSASEESTCKIMDLSQNAGNYVKYVLENLKYLMKL